MWGVIFLICLVIIIGCFIGAYSVDHVLPWIAWSDHKSVMNERLCKALAEEDTRTVRALFMVGVMTKQQRRDVEIWLAQKEE